MKLSELRPCDSCGGPLKGGVFRIVETRFAAVNAREANGTLALTQYFGGGGGAFALAEVMSPTPDAVKVTPKVLEKFFLCMECWCKPVCLAELAEKRADAERDKEG